MIDFRTFLERHGKLLRALPVWKVQLIVPVHKMDAISVYKAAFQGQLASPMRPTILGDLQWYFDARCSQSTENP